MLRTSSIHFQQHASFLFWGLHCFCLSWLGRTDPDSIRTWVGGVGLCRGEGCSLLCTAGHRAEMSLPSLGARSCPLRSSGLLCLHLRAAAGSAGRPQGFMRPGPRDLACLSLDFEAHWKQCSRVMKKSLWRRPPGLSPDSAVSLSCNVCPLCVSAAASSVSYKTFDSIPGLYPLMSASIPQL